MFSGPGLLFPFSRHVPTAARFEPFTSNRILARTWVQRIASRWAIIRGSTSRHRLLKASRHESKHSNESRLVSVSRTPIELCQFLKFAVTWAMGVCGDPGKARPPAVGLVLLNDAVEMRKRRKLVLGDRVTFSGQTITVGS